MFCLFYEECGDNWNYFYVNAPENCHKVNEGMREFLREFEIEHSDINDICYVQGDQWYIQGHATCIAAYPEGHAIPCPSHDLVCGQDIGGVSYYGDVLKQLALVRDTILTPRYLHTSCPNPAQNIITKQTCGWYAKTRGASCVDSVFQGNFTFYVILKLMGSDFVVF